MHNAGISYVKELHTTEELTEPGVALTIFPPTEYAAEDE